MMSKKLSFVQLESSHPTNMGNAFIDEGCKIMLSKLGTVKTVGGFYMAKQDRENWWQRMVRYASRKLRLRPAWSTAAQHMFARKINLENLPKLPEADFVVLSGCVLTSYTLREYYHILKKYQEAGSKIVFNGAGGSTYNRYEIYTVTAYLKSLKPYALISRDSYAYHHYHQFFQEATGGVDCSFWLPEKHLQGVKTDFAVHVFDKDPSLKVEQSPLILEATHRLTGDSKGRFCSDNVEDYVRLYSGARIVNSDRVHACAVAACYGVPCQLHIETVRSKLFQELHTEKALVMTEKPVQFNPTRINILRSRHERLLESICKNSMLSSPPGTEET